MIFLRLLFFFFLQEIHKESSYQMSCLLILKHAWKYLMAHSRSDMIFGNWKPFKHDEKCFHFTLKTVFALKIFKFLS